MRAVVVAAMIVAAQSSALAAPTAEEFFNEAQTAYERGDYALAIDRWQESYRLSREPALLFNIAQAMRLSGDCAGALRAYKRFISATLVTDNLPRAEDFVRELEATCSDSSSSHIEQAPQQVENTDSGRGLRVAGLTTGGAGIALLTTGLLFGHRAGELGDEVSTACTGGCDWSEQRSKDARGRRYARIGYALDGVGAAAIAAGAVMYYFGVRESAVNVVPVPREAGAVVTWRRSW